MLYSVIWENIFPVVTEVFLVGDIFDVSYLSYVRLLKMAINQPFSC